MGNRRNKPIRTASFAVLMTMLAVFAGMFLFVNLAPRTTVSNYDKDLRERPKLTLESLLSGEYTSGVTSWFTDTICFRDGFKDIAARIRLCYGLPKQEHITGNIEAPDDVFDIGDDESSSMPESSSSAPQVNDSASSAPESASSEPSSEAEPGVGNEEICEGILVYKTRAMELYYGSYKLGKRYAEYLNAYADELPGVNIYSMVIPKACAYYLGGSSYENVAEYTPLNIENINSYLSGVTPVDAYGALLAHADEDIYMRTDHHWSSLGAFYAAQEFARTAGVDFADISSYAKKTRPGYVGTMYKFTGNNAVLLNNPENFVTYIPGSSYTATFYDNYMQNGFTHNIYFEISDTAVSNWYGTFISGDSYITHIHSDVCSNGRKLLIIKDSYGNALSPYFVDSFEDVYIMDMRTTKVSVADFAEEYGVTDMLFAMCTYSATGDQNKYLEIARHQ